jgi:hypothetical protein
MTEGRQPFTAEIKTLAKGPSTYDPLHNSMGLRITQAESARITIRASITVKKRLLTRVFIFRAS